MGRLGCGSEILMYRLQGGVGVEGDGWAWWPEPAFISLWTNSPLEHWMAHAYDADSQKLDPGA